MPDLLSIGLVVLGVLAVAAIVLGVVMIRRRRLAPAPPALTAPEPIAFLEHTGNGDGSRIFALNKTVIVVGRGGDSDVRILPEMPDALTVSRRHAQIRREDDDFVVEDLASRNGVTVNGTVTHRNLLKNGDHVSFGNVEFVFRRSGPEGEAGSGS